MAQYELSAGKARSAAGAVKKKSVRRFPNGLVLDALFCPDDVADPFDTVEWELRTAEIKDERGRGALPADRLRGSHDLEPAGDERRGQQVLLRRGQHAASASAASASWSTA